ncbi:hypothetical protein BH23THE1_BH23THE1_28180 [soil metagenome]
MLSFTVYTISILFSSYFVFFISLFTLWAQSGKHPLFSFLISYLYSRLIGYWFSQSLPRSHTEHVNFEPIFVMVTMSKKDFHVVRAVYDECNYCRGTIIVLI